MGRTVWAMTHQTEGWVATEHLQHDTDPDNKFGNPTGRTLGPFPHKPDIEAALLKAGAGFSDVREVE